MPKENEESKEEKQEETNNEEIKKEEPNKKEDKKTTKKPILIGVVLVVIVTIIIVIAVLMVSNANKKEDSKKDKVTTDKVEYNENTIKGNSLDNFDISFLKIEKKEGNKVYSPLSIKYALSMLSEGTDGQSYNQIKSVIGDYKYKKYKNSANLSLANALFVRDSYKDAINEKYVNTLKEKFDADVVYDSFETPDVINKWVNDKTLNLIPKLFPRIGEETFILANALAIDMEWVNKIQRQYSVSYTHENFGAYVSGIESSGYPSINFNNSSKVKATHIRANANRYNIVKELGEDKIRKEVGEAYQKWLDEDQCGTASQEPTVKEYVDQYIKDINANYNKISNSTDFYFHTDDDVKVFGKDLKKYDGTTLEYVAIMPKKVELKDYVNNLDAKEAVRLIHELKEIKLENFKDGVVTDLEGGIPLFKYDYELDLINDLQELGIKDIFNKSANLSKMTSDKNAFIGTAKHKATIDFSNEGIKAAAVTAMGGMGAAGCYFTYNYDVPVEKIDLMFDKPYLYFIIDKNSGEVWFTGTVYNPTEASEFEAYNVLNDETRR